jgi:RND family efflux transporter MFP subunit
LRTPIRFLRFVPFAVLTVALATGCQKSGPAATTEVQVQVVAAARQPITEHITADAVLSPRKQAVISPQISAPVAKFFVQRGSKVRKGQLLALLDNRSLKAAVLDNQGSYDAAQAAYSTATKATVPEDTEKAKSDLAQARANLDLNLQIVKSRKQLFAEGAIPGRDLDTAQAALVQAQTAYDVAEQHLAALEHVSRQAALKSAQGQLESAKGKYLGAQAELQYSEIRSPIDGVVTDRPLYAGEMAAAGSPLLTVMDTSSLLAKVHLTQPQAQQLKTGDPADVWVPGMATPVSGKLTLISPALDPGSTTIEVWVQVPNPAGQLKPGTAVHVSMSGKTVPNALVVPADSLVTTPAGGKGVMVVGADSVAHLKEVSTGIEDNGLVQIVSGVSPGDQVITKGAYALDDGTKVKVVSGAGDDSAKPEDAKPDAKSGDGA